MSGLVGITCSRPQFGWYCTKPAGHDGPCPTRATWWNYLWRKATGRPV